MFFVECSLTISKGSKEISKIDFIAEKTILNPEGGNYARYTFRFD